MSYQNKSLKHISSVFFTIIILFSFSEPLRSEQQLVQIGEWTIKGYAFDIQNDPTWQGNAKSDSKSSISINIYKDPNESKFKYNPEKNEKAINIDGIGEVVFCTNETGFTQQSLPNPNAVDMSHSLNCIFNQHGFTFRRSERYTREPGSVGPREQFV